ncbi:MAG: nicotinate (nicotinamide) nucleotide adenylyltransferase [Bacteroidales bacterium]|jgi:nicotinate-nucleotide adenylyltransferase
MRVALFFGSFNPLHIGHIAICKYLLDSGEIDQLRLIVSPQNPLKDNAVVDNSTDRLEHVRCSASNLGKEVVVSDIEFSMTPPLYTLNTLRKLSSLEPNNEFILIIGADNLAIIEQWKLWENLFKEYQVWVYPRSGYNGEELCKRYGARLIDAPNIDVSSTQIREGEADGKDLSYLKA